jgi:hypothetical protein
MAIFLLVQPFHIPVTTGSLVGGRNVQILCVAGLVCRRNASPTERAPPPRKTCPSVVLRALGNFPIGAQLSPSAATPSSTVRFPQRAAQRGSSSAPSKSAAPRRANPSKRYADTRAMPFRTILDCILANDANLLEALPKVNAQPGIVAPHHFAGLR